MAKYHLENMRDLILALTKERLKLVEQKIKDETSTETDTANKAFAKSKGKLLCFYCEKSEHIKVNCFKWIATDDGKEYTKNNPIDRDAKASTSNNRHDGAKQAQSNRDNQSHGRSKKPTMKSLENTRCPE